MAGKCVQQYVRIGRGTQTTERHPMRGQLWQECPRCNAEPVCVDCEQCATHCRCAQQEKDAAERRAFEREHPGLLDKIEEHHDQGRHEH